MTETETKQTSGASPFLQWLFLSAVIAVGLGVLGGMLPARVKLLGIFAVIQALVFAFVATSLHRSSLLKPRRLVFILVGVLIVAQSATSFWISFREYSSSIEKQQQENPGELSLDKIDTTDPILKAEFQKMRGEKAASLRLPAYLQHRVAQLGYWSSPWPEIFAAMEILVAVCAGLFFFRQGIRKTHTVSES